MCLGIPGKVIEMTDEEDAFMRMGKVSFGGSVKEVSMAYVPDAKVDDYVIVHAGFALSVIDEQEANEVFAYLTEMGEAIAELDEKSQSQ